MTFKVVIILTVFLAAFVHSGIALECLQCSGISDKDCAKGSGNIATLACPEIPDDVKDLSDVNVFAPKFQTVCTEVQVTGPAKVMRACGIDQVEVPAYCLHLIAAGIATSCRTCTSDSCNNTPFE